MKKVLLALFVIGVGITIASFTNPRTDAIPGPDPDNCLDNLKIPQRFTPDGDTLDDMFIVDFPCQPESYEFQVFDMTGKEVYITKTATIQWNGDDKEGNPCASGIYDWKIRYMYHMKYVERKGQTLLLR
jgi:gliding motility-associated-like protein